MSSQNNSLVEIEAFTEEIREEANPRPTIYYDAERKEYLLENDAGRWISYNQNQIKRKLRARGYSAKAGDNPLSEVENFMEQAEEHFDIQYAGPIAGKKAGFYQENGLRFLVTEGPQLIEPAPGQFPTLQAILQQLFQNGETEGEGQRQLQTFYGWLRHAVTALRAGKPSQAQALAICGSAGSGKSLLQKIISLLLGGRSAKGARYMTGKTDFNSELCTAEHVILEDEHMSNRMSDRLAFATQIKNVTVSTDTVSCHRKGRQAVNLSVWWRVTITLNDNPEDLRILPPMNESVRDKIILLRASCAAMPMPTTTPDERSAFWEAIRAELPAFLNFLIQNHRITEADQCPRYGIATWHHPELVTALHEISPEAHLLKLMDSILWETGRQEWKGTADELRKLLLNDERTRRDTQSLMESVTACGTFLGRLSKNPQTKNRIIYQRTESTRSWLIKKNP